MPRVARLNIAPVRSLGLETRDEIDLGPDGVAEDRRFYVIDAGDRLVDQLTSGEMVQVGSWTNQDATRLRLTFPDGTVVEDEVRLDGAIETHIHGRTAAGHIVEGPWAALSRTSRAPGPHRSLRPGRRDQEGASGHAGERRIDGRHRRGARRRRPRRPAVPDADRARWRAAHEEDTWIGCRIGLGGAILRISAPVPRCAMTTHDPETGLRDYDTLRAIKEYRGQVDGKDLMFGVWGEVERPGVIRLGDEVRVLA